jgi:hypothetical protein
MERAVATRIDRGHEERAEHQAAGVTAEDDQSIRLRNWQGRADKLEHQRHDSPDGHSPSLGLPGSKDTIAQTARNRHGYGQHAVV